MRFHKYSVLLIALPLSAQAPQPPLILRSTTRLVQLNVVVQDKKGNPVTDLKKEDFEIREGGKTQTISLFSMESNAPLPTVSEPPPPNTFTNKLERRSGAPASVSVILLDWLNTKFADRAYAQAQVIKFLQQIQTQDRIGLYTLNSGLRVLHDYTSDSTELLQRLAANGKDLPNLSASEQHGAGGETMLLDNWLLGRGASRAEADFYTVNRVQGTLKAIEFIARHLATLPGRKNLIWVSGGFPLTIGLEGPRAMSDPAREHRTFSDEIDRTVRAVNDANLAIYPVDARGLVTNPVFSAEHPGNANRRPPKASTGMGPINRNQDTMRELASRTGGRAYLNTNDLKNAVRDAILDSRVTYTLGFYPAAEQFDGKFHELKLKVDRPGVNLRYRKGYFDFSEQPQDEKTRQTELRDAVWSPMEASGIGLTVQAQPDASKPKSMNVFVKIDPRGISLQHQGDRWDGRLDLLFVQKDDRGGQYNGVSDTMELRLLQANYEKVSKDGLIYKKTIELASQASALRVVVRDAASGTVGTVTVPFREIKK
jgi:VWFA-related protein